jgi:alcohol dehydrogenase
MNPTAEALVLTGPNTLEHRTFDIPDITADTARLRIEACGLCGTDHEQYSGHITAPFSFIPGHEIVGIIDEIGDNAAARWRVAAGDRVAVEVFRSCRQCEPCARGEYRRCIRNGLATMFGFVDAQIEPGLWGGYATHLHLPSDSMLLPIPDSLDPVLATVFNPLGAGIRWGATIPETKSGDVVVVLGPGIRGLCAAVAAKEAGASFVALTGLGPRDRDRLDIAHRFGVDLAIDVAVDDPTVALKRATGGLADVVVDVTAKAPAAFAQAVALARPGGTIVVAGTRGGGGAPGFEPDHLVYKELRIMGSLGVDFHAYRAAIDLLVAGRWPFADLSRRVAGFGDLPALLDTLSGADRDAIPPLHGVFSPSA